MSGPARLCVPRQPLTPSNPAGPSGPFSTHRTSGRFLRQGHEEQFPPRTVIREESGRRSLSAVGSEARRRGAALNTDPIHQSTFLHPRLKERTVILKLRRV